MSETTEQEARWRRLVTASNLLREIDAICEDSHGRHLADERFDAMSEWMLAIDECAADDGALEPNDELTRLQDRLERYWSQPAPAASDGATGAEE